MERSAEAPSKTLEGDALSAPIFPARLRGLVLRNGAGLRPARIERHGGRPSRNLMERSAEAPSKTLEGSALSAPMCHVQATPCLQE